jgi:hypothetical protein
MQRFLWLVLLCLLATGCASRLRADPEHIPSADPAHPGRWIVVTAPAFADALQPLIQHRQAEGFDVIALQTTDLLTPDDLQKHDGRKLLAKVRSLWQPDPAHSFVLLVGAAAAATPDEIRNTTIPTFPGTVGRMTGQPTDNPYGCAPDQFLPTVPVGRFPARTPAEAQGMVQKTLTFEADGQSAPWRRSITMLVGNPGGDNAVERTIADWLVGSETCNNLQTVFPSWTFRSIFHFPESPWYVPDQALHDQALKLLLQGQTFTFYAGHSSRDGFWSGGTRFLDRQDFARLNLPHGAGVFMSCSCDACQFDPLGRLDRDGFALTAMRNPAGLVAVIGSTGESYGAAGVLAFRGMVKSLTGPQLPDRLGGCWLNVANGIANEPLDFLTFTLYDYGDGGGGKIPLATQRLEHLQMWTLLGDPALKLPDVAPELTLRCPTVTTPGATITITGTLPKNLPNARIRLTLERPPGGQPTDLLPVPTAGPDRERALFDNFAKSQNPVLATLQLAPTSNTFQAALQVPAEVPGDHVIIRAVATHGDSEELGVCRVNVLRPPRPIKLP